MLGYCGINCGNCPAYKGTVNYDISLLEKAAGSFWNGAYPVKDWVCLGCQPADQSFIAKFCAECKIRKCAVEKGIQNCAACSDFEKCAQLQNFIKGESDGLVRTMHLLRERFLDIQEQNTQD